MSWKHGYWALLPTGPNSWTMLSPKSATGAATFQRTGESHLSSFRIDVSFPLFTSEFKKAKKKFPTFVNDVTLALATVQGNPRAGDQIPNKINLFKITPRGQGANR
jgi:hypothetical protein